MRAPDAIIIAKPELAQNIKGGAVESYKSLHGSVQSVTMVTAELGVSALQGGVSGSLGLLDTVFHHKPSARLSNLMHADICLYAFHQIQRVNVGGVLSVFSKVSRRPDLHPTYPFL